MLRFFNISFLCWLNNAISVCTLRYSCAICLCSSKISRERLHVSSGVRGLRSASKRRQTLPKSSLVVLLPTASHYVKFITDVDDREIISSDIGINKMFWKLRLRCVSSFGIILRTNCVFIAFAKALESWRSLENSIPALILSSTLTNLTRRNVIHSTNSKNASSVLYKTTSRGESNERILTQ